MVSIPILLRNAIEHEDERIKRPILLFRKQTHHHVPPVRSPRFSVLFLGPRGRLKPVLHTGNVFHRELFIERISRRPPRTAAYSKTLCRRKRKHCHLLENSSLPPQSNAHNVNVLCLWQSFYSSSIIVKVSPTFHCPAAAVPSSHLPWPSPMEPPFGVRQRTAFDVFPVLF